MSLVTFQPGNIKIEAESGTNLAELIKKAGIDFDLPCGAKGTCGKCIVTIKSGLIDSENYSILSRDELSDGYVCACRARVSDSDIVIILPDNIKQTKGKFTDSLEDYKLVQQNLFPKNFDYNPLAVKWMVNVPPPMPLDGLSDIDRLSRLLQTGWGVEEITYPLSVIRRVSDAIRENDGEMTLMLIREPHRCHVVGIEPGNTTVKQYGIAVDIGTTTIAVQLVNLPSLRVMGTANDYNAQIKCGLDIISRINYAQKPERLEELRILVMETINKLIKQVCVVREVAPHEIFNAVISGNTTMIHLFLGLKPEHIRLHPYTPTVLKVPFITAAEVGIDINPESWMYISPAVGSYVGGDITAGILCTDLATESEEVNLFIDIGTNGEIVLGNNDFLISCACSAGPAFEGGGIENGVRASLGAIDNIDIDQNTGAASWSTIGNVRPVGICGTGIISLLANLLITGWIDPAGKLNREKECESIDIYGKKAYFNIVPASESGTSKAIRISENEFENIIRAKAAIFSAVCLIMDQIGIGFDDLSKVYIAGGFGRYLNLKDAKTIGLIPDLPLRKFRYIGNSSLIGSNMILVSQEFREKQIELANRMTYIDLSTDPNYMNQYTAALFMPHTNLGLFPSVNISSGQ